MHSASFGIEHGRWPREDVLKWQIHKPLLGAKLRVTFCVLSNAFASILDRHIITAAKEWFRDAEHNWLTKSGQLPNSGIVD
jgi:hypothetical protein